MSRIKRGGTTSKKHKRILDAAKGYRGRRKNTIRVAKQAVEKAGQYAYRDRTINKRNFRALWIQRINAAVRAEVQKWVDQANEGVSRAESVRKFIILPEEFTQENGLMTASMKVIRPKVIKRYATLLNTQMYTKKK